MSDINNPTKLPSIPSLEGVNDPATRTILEAIKEILEVREGTRPKGQGLDRSVTYRELFDAGIINLVDNGKVIENASPNNGTIAPNNGTGGTGTGTTPVIDLTPPARPTGLIATGAMFNILLEWNEVATGYMEIWRSDANDIGTAVKIGKSTGFAYPDYINQSNVTKYYWIRQVSSAGIAGDFNSQLGTPATTSADPSYLLDLLDGQITTQQLVSSLNSRIDLVDNGGSAHTTVDSRIGVAISVEAGTRSDETGHLFGQYTVKVDSNGYVSGFGLANTANNATPYSEFVIVADKFSIAPVASNPNSVDGSPFYYLTSPTTVNGVTVPAGAYMKAAYIADATIINAMIANAAIDEAKILDLTVSNAKIKDLSVNKLISGTIAATESITVGSGPNRVIVDGVGNIRMGATGFGTGSGLYFGSYGGYATFFAGSASGEYVSFNGINLNINTAQFQILNGNATFSGALAAASGSFSGALLAATGTFSGELQAATGSFSGALNAATGSFGGSLLAGVLDFSSFQGVNYQYLTPGTYTVTVPSDKTTMRVRLAGGGGGGGGSADAGGSPNYRSGGSGGGGVNQSVATFSGMTAGATVTIVVGAGGAGGAYKEGTGQAGGTSAVNGYISVGGGGGGAGGHQNRFPEFVGAGSNGGGAGGGGGTTNGGNAGSAIAGVGGNGNVRGGDGGAFQFAGYNGGAGGSGYVIVEFFNPNAVVLRTDYNTLISALQRQNIATT